MLPDPGALLLFMTAALALNLTPGPDMLYVVARSVGEGRMAGIVSSFGIAAGCLVHTLAVALGLAGILQTVPVAFDIVKWMGAGYLAWLGVRALSTRNSAPTQLALPVATHASIFAQGMLTNVLNPKVALFFLAFLPQFADPERGAIATQIVGLGLLFNISGTLVNVVVAVLASGAGAVWSRTGIAGSGVLRRVAGVLFIGLAVRLVFLERN